jgi:hypothetical protein
MTLPVYYFILMNKSSLKDAEMKRRYVCNVLIIEIIFVSSATVEPHHEQGGKQAPRS